MVDCLVAGSGYKYALAVNRLSFEPHSLYSAFSPSKVCMEVFARGRIGCLRSWCHLVAIALLLLSIVERPQFGKIPKGPKDRQGEKAEGRKAEKLK